MSFNAAIVVATFIVTTTAIVLLIVTASRKRAAKEDELKRVAATRGWHFESTSEGGYRVHRWSGTTEGVPWRAESLYYPSNSKQRRPNLARWHGEWNPGINAPVLCMAVPNGKELQSTQMAPVDGFLGKLAQKAVGFAFDKAVDGYFGADLGKQVDAGAMHRVATTLPGFIVMAANKDEGARLLAHGLEHSLATAAHDAGSIFSVTDKPWILFRPNGVSFARIREFRDSNDIDGFVRAGVALSRSSKFSRPFA